MVLDPANGFNVDRTLTKDDVEKLITVSFLLTFIIIIILLIHVHG